MSDEQNTEQPTTEAPETEAPGTTESVEKLKADLEKWRSMSRKNEDRAKENAEAAKAWAEYQEANKSAEEKREAELEKLRTELAEAKATVAKKDRDVLVERVSAKTGVDPEDLRGDTEDELVASAEKFIEKAKRFASPEKPSGYVPSQGTGEPTPPATSLDEVRDRAKRFARK